MFFIVAFQIPWQDHLEFIINTLLENDYPPDFIFETTNLRLKDYK